MAQPADITLVHTNDYTEACRLRDAGYEPIECAYGQRGSVLGPLALDHHGSERHREGVALRACRDLYGALQDDPRFVVTGTPDADAVLAIVALAACVSRSHISADFYTLVDRNDVDPIGQDPLANETSEALTWFNQRGGLYQSEQGFRKAIGHMTSLLEEGLTDEQRHHLRRFEAARRRRALEGIVQVYGSDGIELPTPRHIHKLALCRGANARSGPARVVVVKSAVWGFDQWYRVAPVVVSYASRMAKITVGCPDAETASELFGESGLMNVWPKLGAGWGGRESIGGSPRGERLRVRDTRRIADRVIEVLQPDAL